MRQMTLFEFEPVESTDINEISEEEMVMIVGCAVGLDFRYKDELFGWVAGDKKMNFSIHYSTYTCYDRLGVRHIGCGYNYNTKGNIGGACSPCDSIEEAIDFFRKGIERWAQ